MNAPVTVFSCRRSSDITRCSTAGCGGIAVAECKFELRGRLAGKTCNRPLCVKCSSEKGRCPAHERLVNTSI